MGEENIECVGCLTYDREKGKCLLPVEYNNKICPCIHCIIKGVCIESCKKYEVYRLEVCNSRR